MPFAEILEKSIKYPWKHKALWFYGFLIALVGGFSGGSSNFNYNISSSDISKLKGIHISNELLTSLLVVGAVVLFVMVVLSLVVGSWSVAAIAKGIENIEAGKDAKRKVIGKVGKKTVWKLVVLTFFLPLGVVLGVVAIGAVLAILVALIPKAIQILFIVLLAVAAVIALIVFGVWASVIWNLAIRSVAIDKKGVIESLKLSAKTVKGKFWLTLGFEFVLGLIAGAAALVFVVPFFILAMIVVGLVIGKLYILAVIIGVFALPFFALYLALAGYLQAFRNTGWTLWWLELKKLKSAE